MKEFTPEEMDGIVKAISQEPSQNEEIPLRSPGNYGTIAKIALSPLEGEKPRPLTHLTEKEKGNWETLKVTVEVVFGKTKMNLKELSAIEKGSLLPFSELCDDLVDIYVQGIKIGRGEIVAVDGHFGVKIVSFEKK